MSLLVCFFLNVDYIIGKVGNELISFFLILRTKMIDVRHGICKMLYLKKKKKIIKIDITLQKPSSSATPFGTSTIYSVLTMWTLDITSAQFTRQNCNLRTLPHHLLKCVISTQISRRAVQTHVSVSASTIREITLHSGLSTFLIWTATFLPIQLTLFIYLNW